MSNENNTDKKKEKRTTENLLYSLALPIGVGLLSFVAGLYVATRDEDQSLLTYHSWAKDAVRPYEINWDIKVLDSTNELQTTCKYLDKSLLVKKLPNGGFIATPYTIETRVLEQK